MNSVFACSDVEMESNRDEVEVEDSQILRQCMLSHPSQLTFSLAAQKNLQKMCKYLQLLSIFFINYSLSSTSNKVILISDEGIPKKHKQKMKKEKKDRESINKDVPGVPDLANVSIGEFGIFVTLFSRSIETPSYIG